MLQVRKRLWDSSSLRNPSTYIMWSGHAVLDEYHQEREQREAREKSDAEMAATLMQQVCRTVYVHVAM